MASRTVIDGNAFYEIDEECMEKKQKAEKSRTAQERQCRKGGNKEKNSGEFR